MISDSDRLDLRRRRHAFSRELDLHFRNTAAANGGSQAKATTPWDMDASSAGFHANGRAFACLVIDTYTFPGRIETMSRSDCECSSSSSMRRIWLSEYH
jgi:hypothetical protein